MTMEYAPGEEVELIDETTRGKIIEINKDGFTIVTQEGFRIEVSKSDVVKVPPKVFDIDNVNCQKEELNSKPLKKDKVSLIEVDLHIENILKTKKYMSNHDIVIAQINHAKKMILKAQNQKISRLIFIHGVGTGRLKHELYEVLKKYPVKEIYDAAYQKYGKGATEVILKEGW